MAITEYEDKIKSIVDSKDHATFIYDFLEVYDKISKATITKLRKGSNNLSKVPGEVHLKNKLYFKETMGDVLQVYSELEDKVAELKSKPRYVIVTDYVQLLAKDEETGDSLDIKFKELPRYFDFFLAWNGIEKADFEKENPADIKAAERFAKIFDAILKENQDVDRHGLNLFLIRLLFCLFAEDTEIFETDLFTNYLRQMTAADGSDMNERLAELFAFLDKENRSGDEPSYLTKFPYVNGSLFTDPHTNLNFNAKIRDLMIDAGELIGWQSVNPDILGSMLQAVATEDKRSHLGMHYTSVPNIMKVIKPLFLDEFREAFEEAKGDVNKLNRLLERIGNIKFMDPACGSGNFLVITYKELRRLELDILSELNKLKGDTMYLPVVSLSQFYGIEIEDFACDVTRLSLWIADHQMNRELTEKFGEVVRPTLPLQKSGDIHCGNALRIDWNEVLPHEKDDEVYLFGNPPYLGAKKQSKEQKEDLKTSLWDGSRYKKLDYISGWFSKGAVYIYNTKAKLAFVTTNSISQGEQISLLWEQLLNRIQIIFAYESFKWGNNAKDNAGVMVEIIGLAGINQRIAKKYLFKSSLKREVEEISPYLTDSKSCIVYPRKDNINGLPRMVMGSMPRDGGYLILSSQEKDHLLSDGVPKNYIRKYVGASEFVKGKERYCLWLHGKDYKNLKHIPEIQDRVNKVKEYRLMSKAPSTRKAANEPWAFVQRGEYINAYNGFDIENKLSLIIPKVTSGNRKYVPMGLISPLDIIFDKAMAIYNSPIWLLGLLQSKIHMVWLRSIGGKLKTDYSYSNTLVYNTFPVPELSTRRKNEIEDLVFNILDIREEEGGTLAELYGSPLAEKNPKPMNPRLLEAHQALDEVVDRAYKASGFKDDNERLALLLDMYSKKVSELNER